MSFQSIYLLPQGLPACFFVTHTHTYIDTYTHSTTIAFEKRWCVADSHEWVSLKAEMSGYMVYMHVQGFQITSLKWPTKNEILDRKILLFLTNFKQKRASAFNFLLLTLFFQRLHLSLSLSLYSFYYIISPKRICFHDGMVNFR